MRFSWDARKAAANYAERSASETRVISARRATRHERGMKKAKKRSTREPSAASLREIPEVDFSRVKVRRNPYAARIAREGIVVQVGRGRPKRLLEVGGTRPRSVRFPDGIWKQIEKTARARGLTVHAALREAILGWLRSAA